MDRSSDARSPAEQTSLLDMSGGKGSPGHLRASAISPEAFRTVSWREGRGTVGSGPAVQAEPHLPWVFHCGLLPSLAGVAAAPEDPLLG